MTILIKYSTLILCIMLLDAIFSNSTYQQNKTNPENIEYTFTQTKQNDTHHQSQYNTYDTNCPIIANTVNKSQNGYKTFAKTINTSKNEWKIKHTLPVPHPQCNRNKSTAIAYYVYALYKIII